MSESRRPSRPMVLAPTALRAAALGALADHTGVADPNKPWWNLNMPKALDIMLPSVLETVAVFMEEQAQWEAPNAAEALRFVAKLVRGKGSSTSGEPS